MKLASYVLVEKNPETGAHIVKATFTNWQQAVEFGARWIRDREWAVYSNFIDCTLQDGAASTAQNREAAC